MSKLKITRITNIKVEGSISSIQTSDSGIPRLEIGDHDDEMMDEMIEDLHRVCGAYIRERKKK